MFAKKNRLAKTTDVKTALLRGRAFFNSFFTIKYLRRQDSLKRFTIVVSTKVSKRAVVRNRLKRLLREFARKNIPHFVAGDYAIIVKPAATKATAAEFVGKFDALTRTAKLQNF